MAINIAEARKRIGDMVIDTFNSDSGSVAWVGEESIFVAYPWGTRVCRPHQLVWFNPEQLQCLQPRLATVLNFPVTNVAPSGNLLPSGGEANALSFWITGIEPEMKGGEPARTAAGIGATDVQVVASQSRPKRETRSRSLSPRLPLGDEGIRLVRPRKTRGG